MLRVIRPCIDALKDFVAKRRDTCDATQVASNPKGSKQLVSKAVGCGLPKKAGFPLIVRAFFETSKEVRGVARAFLAKLIEA